MVSLSLKSDDYGLGKGGGDIEREESFMRPLLDNAPPRTITGSL
jgi:hypothetical protein